MRTNYDKRYLADEREKIKEKILLQNKMFNISKEYLVIKVVPKIAKFQNVILKRTLETKLKLGRFFFWPDTGFPANYLCPNS